MRSGPAKGDILQEFSLRRRTWSKRVLPVKLMDFFEVEEQTDWLSNVEREERTLLLIP